MRITGLDTIRVTAHAIYMTTTRTDSQTGTITREIRDGNMVIVQVSRPNGEWWNISITSITSTRKA